MLSIDYTKRRFHPSKTAGYLSFFNTGLASSVYRSWRSAASAARFPEESAPCVDGSSR